MLAVARKKEEGAAALIADAIRDEIVYDVTYKEFRKYEKGVWLLDDLKRNSDWLPSIARDLYQFAIQHMNRRLKQCEAGWDKEQVKAYKADIGTVSAQYNALYTKRGIDNVLSLLTRKVGMKADLFNRQANLLVLANGVYEFNTDRFRPHEPEDYSSIKSPVVYDVTQKDCPFWKSYLNKAFLSNTELIEYIQKLFGYCLTGFTFEQSLWVCYGNGGAGKSIFFEVQRLLAGLDMCVKLPVEALLLSRRQANYDLVRLHGARIAQAAELPADRRLDESLVKDLTGSESFTARAIHKAPIEITPTHKLFLSGNNKPGINGTDEGIWRRVKLIPFLYNFKSDPDKVNFEAALKTIISELPAVLNWALEGWRNLKADGFKFNPPAIVTSATEEFREEQDQVRQWLSECCNVEDGAGSSLKDLFASYRQWCDGYGDYQKVQNSRSFADDLRRRGHEVVRSSGNKVYVKSLYISDEQEAFKLF